VGAGQPAAVLDNPLYFTPCPLGVWGESERPKVFGSFFLKKNNLFTRD
jgi:hypothetical protein